MKQEIKEKWVKALRSGEYKQGKRVLRTPDNSFCCLGVLCDLIKDEVALSWEASDDGYGFRQNVDMAGGYVEDEVLPEKAMRFIDVDKSNPDIYFNTEHPTSLAALNDKGIPFTTLADLIEQQL